MPIFRPLTEANILVHRRRACRHTTHTSVHERSHWCAVSTPGKGPAHKLQQCWTLLVVQASTSTAAPTHMHKSSTIHQDHHQITLAHYQNSTNQDGHIGESSSKARRSRPSIQEVQDKHPGGAGQASRRCRASIQEEQARCLGGAGQAPVGTDQASCQEHLQQNTTDHH
jgi:hypothetical protein